MKVISIKEPYATLIKDGLKQIETRSWKTKYRGKLYIHASQKKITNDIKNKFANYIDIDDLYYGNIICSCDLVDCVLMTDEFISEIKKNETEFIFGDYQVGRYAWILKNIVVLDKPIKVKGQLGIWNYNE